MISGLRRSCLYVPGDSERMLSKAQSLPADLLLLNLEDGVASALKDAARANVAAALQRFDFGRRELVVRINGREGGIGLKDIGAVVRSRPDGICLPKVEDAGEVRTADEAIRETEERHGMPCGIIRLHAMIESARGVLNAAQIAAASPRMASLVFGSADYAKDVGCRPGPDRVEFQFAMQMIVIAARAGGIDAIDAPCFEIRNADQLRAEAQQGRRLGFDGKSVLHPDQLAAVNELFDVSDQEVAWAEKALAELDAAEARGRSISTLDGFLVDNPHRAAAKRILRRAALTGKRPDSGEVR